MPVPSGGSGGALGAASTDPRAEPPLQNAEAAPAGACACACACARARVAAPSSAADPPPTCARGSVATHGALLIENAALKRQLSSAEWGRDIYRDRASALEEEVAALKSANTELHSANAQLQGRCERYKDHLWAANWSAGVCRENYKRLSRSWQSDYRNNCVKFARLQNDADAASRQTAELAKINSELRRRDEQLRDERDALQNALLQTQCGQARRAVERARERATSEPMHPLEAAMP